MGTNNSAKISEQGRIYSLDENDIIPVSSGGTRASITGDTLKTIIKEEAKTVCVSTETTNKFLPATKIISVRFAFDSNIPYTNIANGVIRILKEELVGYDFVDGDKLHFRKQTVVTVNGVYLVQSQDETSITLTKLYNDEILNEVFVEENSLAGVWFSSYNGTSLTFDWIKPFNAHRGGIVKVDYEAGSPMQFRDIYTNELLFEVDENGQLISYGRAGFANGAFISKTESGQKRFEINTLNGNSYIYLYDTNEVLKCVIDSATASKLLGADMQNNQVSNVANGTEPLHAVNKSQLDLVAHGGGSIGTGQVFLSNVDSDIATYKTLSYSVDVSATEFSAVVDNNTVSVKKFLYPSELDLTTFPSGNINHEFYARCSSASSNSYIIVKGFYRQTNGIEVLMYTKTSQDINSTTNVELAFEETITTPITNIPAGSRFGIEVLVQTTRTTNTTIYFTVGDGLASWISLPITSSHDRLRRLGWTESGHTGTANKIFGSGANGEAVEYELPITNISTGVTVLHFAKKLNCLNLNEEVELFTTPVGRNAMCTSCVAFLSNKVGTITSSGNIRVYYKNFGSVADTSSQGVGESFTHQALDALNFSLKDQNYTVKAKVDSIVTGATTCEVIIQGTVTY